MMLAASSAQLLQSDRPILFRLPAALRPGRDRDARPAASLISIRNHRRSLRSGPPQACGCSPASRLSRMAAFGSYAVLRFVTTDLSI
jgi:hypothetical protein